MDATSEAAGASGRGRESARGAQRARVAVVGAGYIAREHLACLATLRNAEVVAVCDRSAVMAEATADQFRVPAWYTDHAAMLAAAAPDVVHVATPPRSHVPLALAALEAGAHVFVEKPIATSAADLATLERAARERGLWLVEDHNYLFNPAVQRMLALAHGGELGDVVHVEATFCVDIAGAGSRHADPNGPSPFAGLPGGPFLDFATHLAYLAHAFVGPHRSVQRIARKRSANPALAADELRAQVDAERGTAWLGFSSHSQPDAFSLRVHGTRLRAEASLFEPLLRVERVRGGPSPLQPVANGLDAARAFASSAIGGLARKLSGRPLTYAGLWTLLARLYDALESGEAPPIAPAAISATSALVFDLLDGIGDADAAPAAERRA
ncbi:MAG: Gfo/Idh/MocA family oxidoreductase [Myxococcales bacterium]|nr:Gfo/Idh/MocA family oxidoreductase [Myxococcales bacterium]